MGVLRAFTVFLAVGMGGATTTLAAPPDRNQPPPTPPARPAKAAAPAELLRTGARLYNKGLVRWAAKYFDAANEARQRLTPDEQIVLDVYLKEVEDYSRKLRASLSDSLTRPPVDKTVARASLTSGDVGPTARSVLGGKSVDRRKEGEPKTAQVGKEGPAATRSPGTREVTRYDSTDGKQKGRWALQNAREEIAKGNLDEAARIVSTVRTMNVHWGYWDDSPDKVSKIIDEVRTKAGKGSRSPTARPLGVRVAPGSPQ